MVQKPLVLLVLCLMLSASSICFAVESDQPSPAESAEVPTDIDTPPRAAKQTPKPKTQKYNSVEKSGNDPSEYFKGTPPPGRNNIYVDFGLNYLNDFGVGARYSYRLINRGPLYDLNNSLNIECGAGTTFYGTVLSNNNVTGWHGLVDFRWDFQMNSLWVFFAEAGIGYNVVVNGSEGQVHGGGWFPVVGAGAFLDFNDDWAARGDLSYELIGLGIVRRF